MIQLTIGNQQFRLSVTNAGVSGARRRVGAIEGETVRGRWRRRAVGIADYETLQDYRAAVRDVLLDLGLTNAQATDAFWQGVTANQWDEAHPATP